MNILITGGAGYIGSHTAIQVLNAGHDVVIVDSLANSSIIAIERIRMLANKNPSFIMGDVRDRNILTKIFSDYAIDAVIHFAGLKAVGESHQQPIEYFDVNVNGTLQLLKAMENAGVKKLVFSSSATVYGEDAPVPYVETLKRGTTSSPYGTSKAMVEKILEDITSSKANWSIAVLRYFNPIGAHPSGMIGEDPKGIPNNLMPFISQVAVGKRTTLSIFGNDYPTEDGTCQRDYLHVMDLADGHLCALDVLNQPGCHIYNLGTGNPLSVLEMVSAFEMTNNISIPFEFAPRRSGDLAAFWADATKARSELQWTAKRSLQEMMNDTWNWQKQNPNGYEI